jgi:hypothetical protein
MSLILSGTDGLSDVDGSASTPAIRGTDTNTGIFFPAADTIAFAEGGAEVARFDSSGNLGIGTTTPARKLQVHEATAATNAYIQLSNAATGATSADGFQLIVGTGGETILAQRENAEMQFWTNNTERMRIDSSGQVLIGTATAPSGASKLNSPAITIYNEVNTTEYRYVYYSNSTKYLYFTNGSNAAYLSNTGAWTNASDGRLKNSIVDIAHGLDSVMATQPRSFKFNETEGDYVGFIAQELQTVIPEVVSGDPETQLGVDYGSLVAVAFKAIQEQQAIITDLKARLEILEAK